MNHKTIINPITKRKVRSNGKVGKKVVMMYLVHQKKLTGGGLNNDVPPPPPSYYGRMDTETGKVVPTDSTHPHKSPIVLANEGYRPSILSKGDRSHRGFRDPQERGLLRPGMGTKPGEAKNPRAPEIEMVPFSRTCKLCKKKYLGNPSQPSAPFTLFGHMCEECEKKQHAAAVLNVADSASGVGKSPNN